MCRVTRNPMYLVGVVGPNMISLITAFGKGCLYDEQAIFIPCRHAA